MQRVPGAAICSNDHDTCLDVGWTSPDTLFQLKALTQQGCALMADVLKLLQFPAQHAAVRLDHWPTVYHNIQGHLTSLAGLICARRLSEV